MRLIPVMLRLVPYVLYLFLIAFFRLSLSDFLSIGPAKIFLTILLVELIALNKDYFVSMWFGCAAGLVYDAQDPTHLGVHMIVLSFIGLATAQVKDRLNLESMRSKLILIMMAVSLYSIPYVLVYETSGTSQFFLIMIRMAIPSIIYTTIVGGLFFMFQSGQLSYEKLKTIF
jgi:rod shape-determining protein MreD